MSDLQMKIFVSVFVPAILAMGGLIVTSGCDMTTEAEPIDAQSQSQMDELQTQVLDLEILTVFDYTDRALARNTKGQKFYVERAYAYQAPEVGEHWSALVTWNERKGILVNLDEFLYREIPVERQGGAR